MINYEILNKKNFISFIECAYDDIIDDYIRAKYLNDFKLETFCRGYLCCLDTISTWYNIKLSKNIIDKRNTLDYI